MALPQLGLSLGISPYSSATSGLDMFGDHGGATIGGVSFGGDQTALTPVIRDAATVVLLAMAVVWLWKRYL